MSVTLSDDPYHSTTSLQYTQKYTSIQKGLYIGWSLLNTLIHHSCIGLHTQVGFKGSVTKSIALTNVLISAEAKVVLQM
jgi:hypothetical protein